MHFFLGKISKLKFGLRKKILILECLGGRCAGVGGSTACVHVAFANPSEAGHWFFGLQGVNGLKTVNTGVFRGGISA